MATGERTEQPTQRRRRRAREKGQVAKSVDLSRALGLLLIYLGWRVAGDSMADNLLRLVRACFASPMGGSGNPPSFSAEQVMAGYQGRCRWGR